MKILLAGGGSGGHVTPLKSIAESLGVLEGQHHKITVLTDRQFYPQTKLIFAGEEEVTIRRIFSGKLRRYGGKSLLWHFVHLPTLGKNLRDIIFLLLGFFQTFWFFLRNKPDVVFAKGGYVCVPIGLVTHLFGVRLIIHDSDTHPGLTNRFLARWAEVIATGAPCKYYSYDKSKMIYTGIPVSALLKKTSQHEQQDYKAAVGVQSTAPLLLVTGGGTGAQKLNDVVATIAPELLASGWQIVQVTGRGKDRAIRQKQSLLSTNQQRRWIIQEFVNLPPYILAADLVVSRTGASAMQEFANAQKPVITVPAPQVTGDHQAKNARMFSDANSVIVLREADIMNDPERLRIQIEQLLNDSKKRQMLAKNLYTNFAKLDAADRLAQLIANSASVVPL